MQLGDSIASGEGTLYGYTYDQGSEEWTGGNIDAKWPPPYPDCHVSPDAYGNAVAKAFGASFTQFACTGATFDVGHRRGRGLRRHHVPTGASSGTGPRSRI